MKGILVAGTKHARRPALVAPTAPAPPAGETLRTLKLSGMLDTLEARLAQATAGELGHLEFLQVLCEDEINRRDAASLARRIRQARFEHAATLEEFDFAYNPKVPAAIIRDLAVLRFVEAGQSVILHGPVGVGKTFIAQALDHQACRRGYTTASSRPARLLADLAGGHADRTWGTRLRRWAKPDVLVLDDFAMRDFTTAQADDLYELITERADRSFILTANRAAVDWYPLFPNPSSPNRSSTGSSTPPTTSTWTAAGTDPTSGPAHAATRR